MEERENMFIIIQISLTATATINTHGGPYPAGSVPGAGNHVILSLTPGQTGLALPLSKDILVVKDIPCVLPWVHSTLADSAHTLFLAPWPVSQDVSEWSSVRLLVST